jgi:hypothetical protein
VNFNLSKMAQARLTEAEQPLVPEIPSDMASMDPQAEGMDQVELPSFDNSSELFEFLNHFRQPGDPNSGYPAAWNGFFAPRMQNHPNASQFEEALQNFFQVDENSQDAVDIAKHAFDAYSSPSPTVVPMGAVEKSASAVAAIVSASDEQIALLAEKFAESHRPAKSASVVFNLIKHASHGDMRNVVLFGPGQVKPSPIIRDIESNLSAVERNKSNGFFVGDVYDIDFETLWRGNVMDKYYRPFDGAHGLSGGGYIDDRFEVNRNVPVGNDLRVPADGSPRPFIPEFSGTEARLSAARGDLKGHDGRVRFAPLRLTASKKKN